MGEKPHSCKDLNVGQSETGVAYPPDGDLLWRMVSAGCESREAGAESDPFCGGADLNTTPESSTRYLVGNRIRAVGCPVTNLVYGTGRRFRSGLSGHQARQLIVPNCRGAKKIPRSQELSSLGGGGGRGGGCIETNRKRENWKTEKK
jgi:hypothetical protein